MGHRFLAFCDRSMYTTNGFFELHSHSSLGSTFPCDTRVHAATYQQNIDIAHIMGGRRLTKQELNSELTLQASGINTNICFLDKKDENEAVSVFADAFSNDPMLLWVAGLDDDDPQRKEKLHDLVYWMMRFINRRYITGKRGAAVGLRDEGGELVGCMTVAPSSCKTDSVIDDILGVIHYGMPPMFKTKGKKKYCPTAGKRLEMLDKVIKARRKHTKGISRWIYLQTIGVLSAHHGKGYGGKLLRTLINAADSLGAAIYLDTEAEELESMYRHFGFRTVEKMVLTVRGDTRADASLTMYLMLRDAKAAPF